MRSLLASILLVPTAAFAGPGLTIYNADFAVVRDSVPLELKAGVNDVVYEGATLQLEPDSVILRDPSGAPLQILEQTYRNDPVTQSYLLSLYEGKSLDFLIREQNKPDRTVNARVIRSGYVPPGQPVNGASEPMVEFAEVVRFGLPGEPLFPPLQGDVILKPRLEWKIAAKDAVKLSAELGYVTAGLSWEASYNIVAPESGNTIDLVGWITMKNLAGRTFEDAQVRLMAGDVKKIVPPQVRVVGKRAVTMAVPVVSDMDRVTEKAFDEYHLYSLPRPVTLRDQETKQVEFLRAAGMASRLIYVYDGFGQGAEAFAGADAGYRATNSELGTQSQTKVAVMREFKNSKENKLGIPLPKGRVRFYRADGAQLEFVGENEIDHTPADETVKLYTGDAFDLVGERTRTDFRVDTANRTADESFEISLRNRKKEPVTIRVVEHLYRGANWKITAKSDDFEKVKSDEIRFEIPVKAGEERKLTYSVRYSW